MKKRPVYTEDQLKAITRIERTSHYATANMTMTEWLMKQKDKK